MESSTSYVTVKDGFEVTLNKTCTELIIEAEDQGNGSVFSSRFSNDAIKSMGLELFENVPELFEGLMTAFEGISEDTSAKLGQDGKLTIIQKVKIGKNEKVFNSPIPLKLVEMDQITRIEKQMRKLFKGMEELKKENRELKEKLGIVDYEMISPEFDASGPFPQGYTISKDKKQIKKISKSASSGLFSSAAMLSQEKNTKFQVKTDEKSYIFAIGLATEDALKNKECFSSSGAYCFNFSSLHLYENGSSQSYVVSSRPYSPIGITYIPNSNKILFDFNGIHVGTANIHPSHQKLDLYPFINFIEQTESAGTVSIV